MPYKTYWLKIGMTNILLKLGQGYVYWFRYNDLINNFQILPEMDDLREFSSCESC